MKFYQMSSKTNKIIICKPLGYRQANLQWHLQFTRTFIKMKWNIRLECKLKCQIWVQEKNNPTTKKWKTKNQKLLKKNFKKN